MNTSPTIHCLSASRVGGGKLACRVTQRDYFRKWGRTRPSTAAFLYILLMDNPNVPNAMSLLSKGNDRLGTVKIAGRDSTLESRPLPCIILGGLQRPGYKKQICHGRACAVTGAWAAVGKTYDAMDRDGFAATSLRVARARLPHSSTSNLAISLFYLCCIG